MIRIELGWDKNRLRDSCNYRWRDSYRDRWGDRCKYR